MQTEIHKFIFISKVLITSKHMTYLSITVSLRLSVVKYHTFSYSPSDQSPKFVSEDTFENNFIFHSIGHRSVFPIPSVNYKFIFVESRKIILFMNN